MDVELLSVRGDDPDMQLMRKPHENQVPRLQCVPRHRNAGAELLFRGSWQRDSRLFRCIGHESGAVKPSRGIASTTGRAIGRSPPGTSPRTDTARSRPSTYRSMMILRS